MTATMTCVGYVGFLELNLVPELFEPCAFAFAFDGSTGLGRALTGRRLAF